MKVFLDDVRIPKDCVHYMGKRIGPLFPIYLEEWKVVSNYDEYVAVLKKHYREITHISFDHDLGEDLALAAIERGMSKRQARKKIKKNVQSGYDCALFTKQFYSYLGKDLPIMFVHSMNPVGTENIINVFKNGKRTT